MDTYLDRLGRIPHTIVICRDHDLPAVQTSIERNHGDAVMFWPTAAGAESILPPLRALDRRIGLLRGAAKLLPFTEEQLFAPRAQWAKPLRSSVRSVIRSARPAIRLSSDELPLGTSPEARRLPPDFALKVIGHTNVEDLTHIPRGEIVQVPIDEAAAQLSRLLARPRCPTCGARLSRLFFYSYGLVREPDEAIRAKCQECMAYLMIQRRRLIEV